MMGTARGATSRAAERKVPSPPSTTTRSQYLSQLGFVYDFAVGGILDIDAVFFYAQFIQIDGEAVFAQKRNQCVDGILNLGRIGDV